MCRSIGVSLATFLLTAVSTIVVWNISKKPEHRFVALFMLTVGSMQLVDVLLWLSIRQKSPSMNMFVSSYILLAVLIAEALVSYYGIKYFFGWSNRAYEALLWIAIPFLAYYWITTCKETTVHPDGYLYWCSDYGYPLSKLIVLLALVLPILFGYPNILLKWLVLAIGISTFVITLAKNTFGTRWCWASNLISVVLLFVVLQEKFFT